MKTSLLPPAGPPDGSEEVPLLQGIGPNRGLKLMSAAAFAQAGTRPTPTELQAAILATLVNGNAITLTDNSDGTVTIAIDATQLASASDLADGLAGKQAASPLLASISALSLTGNIGKTIKVNAAGSGFELDPDLEATGGSGLVDGTYGDVIVSNSGAKLTVTIAVDEAYGPGWNADLTPATKNALFAKIESLSSALAARLSSANVGVANGVAGLDATGKVPASQLPSYVDDVLEYSNAAAFPNPGESGKIYVALDTEAQWRWSGSAYVQLVASPGTTDQVPEGNANKYYTDVRVRAAPMMGLIQTVGAPVATDSLLTVLGKLWRQSFRALTSADMPASVPTIGGDGGMEVGSYLDFHVPTNPDGRDFAARISAVANGSGYAISIGANGLIVGGSSVAYHSDLAAYLPLAGGEITGNLTVDGNITYASDARLKSNIRPLGDGGSAILLLTPKRYVKDDREQIGFIAQEVEKAIPEAVRTGDDERAMKSLDLGPIVAELVELAKCQAAKIAALEARLA